MPILFRQAPLTTANRERGSQRMGICPCSSRTMQRTLALVKINAADTVLLKHASPFSWWNRYPSREVAFIHILWFSNKWLSNREQGLVDQFYLLLRHCVCSLFPVLTLSLENLLPFYYNSFGSYFEQRPFFTLFPPSLSNTHCSGGTLGCPLSLLAPKTQP